MSGAIGWTAGGLVREPADWWLELCREQGVTDVRAFVQVGYIHNAGYLGAAAGIAVAGIWLLRARNWNASGK